MDENMMIIEFIRGFEYGCGLAYMLLKYSYTEIMERLKRFSYKKRKMYEEAIGTVIYDDFSNSRSRESWDKIIYTTIGLDRLMDLYTWLILYNDAEEKEES